MLLETIKILIPIIIAFVSSYISYLRAVNKAKLEMEKELELQRIKHEQELERLEREMEVQNKSKESDILFEFMKGALEDPRKLDNLMQLYQKAEKYKNL